MAEEAASGAGMGVGGAMSGSSSIQWDKSSSVTQRRDPENRMKPSKSAPKLRLTWAEASVVWPQSLTRSDEFGAVMKVDPTKPRGGITRVRNSKIDAMLAPMPWCVVSLMGPGFTGARNLS